MSKAPRRPKRPPPPPLTFEELLRVQNVFIANRWRVEIDIEEPNADLFDRTVRMLSRLQTDQRSLILRLLEQFTWIRADQYRRIFLTSWAILETQLPAKSQVLVTRLVRGKTKSNSSGVVLYSIVEHMQSTLTYRLQQLGHSLKVYDSPAVAWRYLAPHGNNAIVIVDDFVGSGQSVESALETRQRTTNCTIFVVALAAMQEGVNRLSQRQVAVCTTNVLNKGISGNPRSLQADASTMETIENFLGIDDHLKFGFHRSEALAAFIRTPNNTFPVFWTNTKVEKSAWNAPFERYVRIDK